MMLYSRAVAVIRFIFVTLPQFELWRRVEVPADSVHSEDTAKNYEIVDARNKYIVRNI